MKHPLSFEQVSAFIRPAARVKLRQYEQLIQTWTERLNLISHGDRQQLYERHFMPSFFLLSRLSPGSGCRLIELGAGAGFLSVLLKIEHPEMDVTAIDSSRKKCLFLQEVDEQLNLNLKVVHQRIEHFSLQNRAYYDYAVSRAVADLKELWLWAMPMLKATGRMIALKGGDLRKDLQALKTYKVSISTYNADAAWTRIAPYLNEKFLVEVEFNHGPK